MKSFLIAKREGGLQFSQCIADRKREKYRAQKLSFARCDFDTFSLHCQLCQSLSNILHFFILLFAQNIYYLFLTSFITALYCLNYKLRYIAFSVLFRYNSLSIVSKIKHVVQLFVSVCCHVFIFYLLIYIHALFCLVATILFTISNLYSYNTL